jgi:outer membrane lipoprotein LolB
MAGRASSWLRRAACLLAAALTLAGCAGVAPRPAAVTQAPLSKGLAQDFHGRFAVRYVDNTGADRNVYGNFDLHEDGAATTLDLLNPFGQTLARVTVDAGGATLETPDKPAQHADAVEALMQRAIGFPLPLAGLRYWLQPAAAPDRPADIARDPASGRLTQIRQDGWTIDYLAYDTDAGLTPPPLKRVNLGRDDPPLDVKLVIDR